MGPVKCILCKIHHLIKDMVCNLFRNSILNTARNVFFFIAIDKALPFLNHNRCLFLRHSSANQVTPPIAVARKVPNDLHNLFLVYDTAISRRKNRLQLRTFVNDLFGCILSLNIFRNKIHRAGTVERNSGDDILHTAGLKLLHKVFHSGAF